MPMLLTFMGTGAAAKELIIMEGGIPHQVYLRDGLSTDLFLDQRLSRQRVHELAQGRLVLNLFAYTCGFTLAFPLGGVECTVSVDASASVLERGYQQLERLGVLCDRHSFYAEDVFA
ncbi:class I SAM-dependent methyltransferase [Pajaroellobacter abortibovis]|uniref:S-adenosylmethionine-dependent methyltransferase domain-containing protein n=1 Tax=Pajaroellobacter abortibovis TaxID=1882918 RepID=A0A1L6MY12_9BACT|nr:class I SAM-dependent methyltransferase [Pajaroellobacter abortibovis]APS00392.1 hypothetical protein BCY86_06650 [Pajaroellobacter abortibovis]